MRTALFIVAGFVLLGVCLLLGRELSARRPAAPRAAAAAFVGAWFVVASVNLWLGVTQAGYTVVEELPIFALIFGLPAAAAVFIARKAR